MRRLGTTSEEIVPMWMAPRDDYEGEFDRYEDFDEFDDYDEDEEEEEEEKRKKRTKPSTTDSLLISATSLVAMMTSKAMA